MLTDGLAVTKGIPNQSLNFYDGPVPKLPKKISEFSDISEEGKAYIPIGEYI